MLSYFLFSFLAHTDGVMSCDMERPTQWETETDPQSSKLKELNPALNHASELGSGWVLLQSALKMTASEADALNITI